MTDDRKEINKLASNVEAIKRIINHLELYPDTKNLQNQINQEVIEIQQTLIEMKHKYSLDAQLSLAD